MTNAIYRSIARLLIVTIVLLGFPMTRAQAGIIGTDALAAAEQIAQQRARIANFLDRSDVQSQLQMMGVDSNDAKSRVNAMTDQEVQHVAGKLDQLPAGGVDVLVVVVVVFLILLALDILGFTQIFPFTKPIR